MTWNSKPLVIRKMKIKTVSVSVWLFEWKKLERWLREGSACCGDRGSSSPSWGRGLSGHCRGWSAVVGPVKSRPRGSYALRYISLRETFIGFIRSGYEVFPPAPSVEDELKTTWWLCLGDGQVGCDGCTSAAPRPSENPKLHVCCSGWK